MGGFFGAVSKRDAISDVFFGTDYHSHLGTRRGGMAVYGANGFKRAIHNIENWPFRTKFDKTFDEMKGNTFNCGLSDANLSKIELCDVIKKYILGYVNNKCISCSDMDECIDKENLDETAEFLAEKLEKGEPIEHEMLKFDCKHSKQIIDDIYNMYTNMRITRVLKLRELENVPEDIDLMIEREKLKKR